MADKENKENKTNVQKENNNEKLQTFLYGLKKKDDELRLKAEQLKIKEDELKKKEESLNLQEVSNENLKKEIENKEYALSNEKMKMDEEYIKRLEEKAKEYEKKSIELAKSANIDAKEIRDNAINEAKKLRKEIEDLQKALKEEAEQFSNKTLEFDKAFAARLQEKEEEVQATYRDTIKKTTEEANKIRKAATEEANKIIENAEKDFFSKNDGLQKALSDAKLSLSSTKAELDSVKGKYKEIESEYRKVVKENSDFNELKIIIGDDNNLSNVLRDIKEIKEKREELNDKTALYEKDKNSLEFNKKIYEKRASEQDSLIKEKANELRQEEIDSLNEEIERKDKRIKDLEEERRANEGIAKLITDFNDRYKDQDPLDINRQYEKANEKLKASLEGINKLRENQEIEYQNKIQELENSISQKNDENIEKLRELTNIEEEYQKKDAELLRIQNENQTLQTQNNFLNEQIKIYSEAYKNGEEEEKRIEEINKPLFTDKIPPRNKDSKEKDVLQEVRDKIRKQGIIIPDRLLLAFHTALKSQDYSLITVLAGMSGTGKSLLPQLYSHFIGMNNLLVTVLPNWDSPEDMLGYYNQMENHFDAEPVLRFLAQAQRVPEEQNGLGNVMNMILLDEMNLSYVERYFAPFLDLLEKRRNYSQKQVPTYDIKLGTNMTYPIKLTDNVLWTGTMNQDETTKSLSDKVIDRGIVLNFPTPKKLVGISHDIKKLDEESGDAPHLLLKETWENWKTPTEKIKKLDLTSYSETIDKINDDLSKTGRCIGYRSWQSIECYIKNHPEVRENPDDNEAIKRAFEDQIVQKVMPKLRGLATKGEQGKALEKVRSELENYSIVKDGDFDNAMEMGYGQFMWSSSDYLNQSQSDHSDGNYFSNSKLNKDNKEKSNEGIPDVDF